MPSFDIVSKIDTTAVDNALAGVAKEMDVRYDFKGSHCEVSRTEDAILISYSLAPRTRASGRASVVRLSAIHFQDGAKWKGRGCDRSITPQLAEQAFAFTTPLGFSPNDLHIC
jgi:hypothetical protein